MPLLALVVGLIAAAQVGAVQAALRELSSVLPLALSLPAGWELAAVVVVAQSLVELLGLVLLVWAVPGWLFRAPRDRDGGQADR